MSNTCVRPALAPLHHAAVRALYHKSSLRAVGRPSPCRLWNPSRFFPLTPRSLRPLQACSNIPVILPPLTSLAGLLKPSRSPRTVALSSPPRPPAASCPATPRTVMCHVDVPWLLMLLLSLSAGGWNFRSKDGNGRFAQVRKECRRCFSFCSPAVLSCMTVSMVDWLNTKRCWSVTLSAGGTPYLFILK